MKNGRSDSGAQGDRLASGWINYAFWAFDHGLARARKGLFGQRPVEASPSTLEECVRSSGEDGRRMILRTVLWSVASILVLWPLLTGWFLAMDYVFHLGVELDTVWTIYTTGRWLVGILDALCYLAFVLGPFRAAMRALKDTRQAVLALESMPSERRSSWVGEYRAATLPACSVLEARSPVFRSLVEGERA